MDLRCQDIELDRYLDEELSRSRKMRVSKHLADCRACSQHLDALRLQGDLLREELATAADDVDFSGLEDRVLAAIQAQKPPSFGERARMWIREVARHYRAVWISSLVTAAILLVVLIPWLSRGPGEAPAKDSPADKRVAKADVDNEVIIDSMEYAGQRSMVFTVSKNNTTVIWLYDFDRAEAQKAEGDDI